MDQGRLKGRVAIITGGARGIGKATGIKMIKEGASVALLDILSKEISQTAKELQASGGKALGLKADVSHKEEMFLTPLLPRGIFENRCPSAHNFISKRPIVLTGKQGTDKRPPTSYKAPILP